MTDYLAMSALENAVYQLGKELSCSVCLSILHTSCVRLPCCHYFCKECITMSLKVNSKCPVCKAPSNRRDLSTDAKMDKIVELYTRLEQALGQPLLCSQPLEEQNPAEEAVTARVHHGPQTAHRVEDGPRVRALKKGEQPFGKEDQLDHDGGQALQGAGDQGEQRGGTLCLEGGMATGPLAPLGVPDDGVSDAMKVSKALSTEAPPRLPIGGGLLGSSWLDDFDESRYMRSQEIFSQMTSPGPSQRPCPIEVAQPTAPQVIKTKPDAEHDMKHTSGAGATVEPGPAKATHKATRPAAKKAKKPRQSKSGTPPPEADHDGQPQVVLRAEAPAPLVSALATKDPRNGPVEQLAAGQEAAGAEPQLKSSTGALPEPGKPVVSAGQGTERGQNTKKSSHRRQSNDPPVTPAAPTEDGARLSGCRRNPSRLHPWTCPRCTYENASTVKRCEMCEGPRSGTVVTPEPLPSISLAAAPSASKSVTARQGHQLSGPQTVTEGFQTPKAAVKEALNLTGTARRKSAAGGQSGGVEPLGGQPLRTSGETGPQEEDRGNGKSGADPGAEDVTPANKTSGSAKVGKRRSTGGPSSSTKKSKVSERTGGEGGQSHKKTKVSPTTPKTVIVHPEGATWPSWTGGPQDWVLTASGLDDQEKALLRQMSTSCGAKMCEQWSDSVTHVICHLDENQRARRTLKYMMGVMQACWVVGFDWVTACLQAGQHKEESEFLVTGDSSGWEGGPKRCRALCSRNASPPREQKLLGSYSIFLAGNFKAKEDIALLVRASGASLLTRLPPLGCRDVPPLLYVLVDVEGVQASRVDPSSLCATACQLGVPVLGHKWLMDCASSFEVQPAHMYVFRYVD